MTTTASGECWGGEQTHGWLRGTQCPPSVNEAMKYGPPRSPKFREQIVRATHSVAPECVHFPFGGDLHRSPEAVPDCCRQELPLFKPFGPYAVLLSEPDANSAAKTISGRQRPSIIVKRIGRKPTDSSRARARDRSVSSALLVPIPSACEEHRDEKPLPLRDSSLRHRLAPRPRHLWLAFRNAPSRTECGRCGLSLLKAMVRRLMTFREVRQNTDVRPAARPSPCWRNYAHFLCLRNLRQLTYVTSPGQHDSDRPHRPMTAASASVSPSRQR